MNCTTYAKFENKHYSFYLTDLNRVPCNVRILNINRLDAIWGYGRLYTVIWIVFQGDFYG